MNHSAGKVLSRAFSLLVLAAFAIFLAGPFRTGWTQLTTDFPNYYTAAVLVRQGKPLHNYYDWTWFQRQMEYAGIRWQLGAYTPQTPLTMLPIVPLAGVPPQSAKRIWLAVNLALLAATVAMLARVTRIRWDAVVLLMFCGSGSLASNFVLGQYYFFLLFLLTLTLWYLERKQPVASGFLSGITFGLKLYTGPLLLYFAAKKKWSAAIGMLIGTLAMAALAVALFGWSDVHHYLTQILPRTLEGGSIDPYHPGNPTLPTLLRRSFVSEPQLNPHPLLDAPWLFFLLQSVLQLGLPALVVLGIVHSSGADFGRDFAWFVIALMLLSTSVGSYSFILLLLPVALILKDAALWEKVVAIGGYIVLNAHIQPRGWFPKVCVLLLLFLVVGRAHLLSISPRWAAAAAAVIVVLSLGNAMLRMRKYNAEPGRRHVQIPLNQGMLLASYPAISRFGLFFECMGPDRYLLCWWHEGRLDPLSFEGHALRPFARAGDGAIRFELVANGASTMMRFDPSTRGLSESQPPRPASADHAVSPDGKWIARTIGMTGSRELWLENVATGQTERLAGGNCDNANPAWELDSSAIVFASDCGRAYGLPALYRASVR